MSNGSGKKHEEKKDGHAEAKKPKPAKPTTAETKGR